MYFKKLTGQKCYLSPIDENDAPRYTAWFNDLEVTRNLLAFSWSLNEKHEKDTLEKLSNRLLKNRMRFFNSFLECGNCADVPTKQGFYPIKDAHRAISGAGC